MTTSAGPISTRTSALCTAPSVPGWICAATWPGRCSTTSSEPRGTRCGSASSTSTSRPSSGPSRRADTGTANLLAATASPVPADRTGGGSRRTGPPGLPPEDPSCPFARLAPCEHRVLRVTVVRSAGVGVDLGRDRPAVQPGPDDVDPVVRADRQPGVVAVEDVAVLALGVGDGRVGVAVRAADARPRALRHVLEG